METLTHPKETQALQLGDDIRTTEEPVTLVNNSTTDTQMYSMPLMVLIALLSVLITFLLYWIFVLLIKPLMHKSNTCRYLFPCSTRHNDFLTPATDLFFGYCTCKFRRTDQSFSYNDNCPSMFPILHRISQNF